MKLRLVSYNMHKGRSSTGHVFVDALSAALQPLSPDLIFLQELQGRNEKHARMHQQPQRLVSEMRLHGVYGKNAVRRYTDHGNGLLTRFPIEYASNQDISDHRFEQRGMLYARLQVGGRAVHCWVVHLGLFKGGRLRQTQAILERIREVPTDEPLIVAGDFNDWNQLLSGLITADCGLVDVFEVAPARTYPSFFPMLPLDRVYVRGLKVIRTEVLSGPAWRGLSDHLPVLVDFELEVPEEAQPPVTSLESPQLQTCESCVGTPLSQE